jgi:hypothetical protein
MEAPVAISSGKEPRYALDRRMAGPQSISRRRGEDTSLLDPPGIELWFLHRPARNLVTIATEVSRPPFLAYIGYTRQWSSYVFSERMQRWIKRNINLEKCETQFWTNVPHLYLPYYQLLLFCTLHYKDAHVLCPTCCYWYFQWLRFTVGNICFRQG